MIETIYSNNIPIIGSILSGGFYAGRFRIGTDEFALIVAPKFEGQTIGIWGISGKDIEGARSFFDGMANTKAMAESGSEIAKWALGLSIGSYQDWYLPSRDELEILYRNMKPYDIDNCCTFRDGDNASSLPPGFPYTEQSPAQTKVEAFREGNQESFDDHWYWGSTQYSPKSAWNQGFVVGDQGYDPKDCKFHARAVRKIRISNRSINQDHVSNRNSAV